jgi:hypothetical protein
MRRRFKADPRWITVRHPAGCAEPNCQTQVNPSAASTTPATSPFTALAADMAKRPSVILPHTGSTKTATEHNRRTNGGFNHVSQQSNRGRQFRS